MMATKSPCSISRSKPLSALEGQLTLAIYLDDVAQPNQGLPIVMAVAPAPLMPGPHRQLVGNDLRAGAARVALHLGHATITEARLDAARPSGCLPPAPIHNGFAPHPALGCRRHHHGSCEGVVGNSCPMMPLLPALPAPWGRVPRSPAAPEGRPSGAAASAAAGAVIPTGVKRNAAFGINSTSACAHWSEWSKRQSCRGATIALITHFQARQISHHVIGLGRAVVHTRHFGRIDA